MREFTDCRLGVTPEPAMVITIATLWPLVVLKKEHGCCCIYLFTNNMEVVLVVLVVVSVKNRFVLFVELKGEVCNFLSIKITSWTLFSFRVSQNWKSSKLGKLLQYIVEQKLLQI